MRKIALALALSLLGLDLPAQQEPMKEQMRKQQEALQRAREQGQRGQQQSSATAPCAGGWWQGTGLKLAEMVPSVGGGPGFDSACRAHDQCYRNCGGPAQSSCDADLKRDTTKVCNGLGTPGEKKKCADQQAAMSAMIEKMGPGAFRKARERCPARR